MMPPMNVGPTATKKNVLEQLLDQGMVLVALDARIDGVEVPSHLGRDAQLRLNLSYRFGLPMTVDDWGILATLTFAGVPFACRFPWRSVFLLVSHVSGQPYLFPDDIPPELLSQATAEAGIDAKIFTSADIAPTPAARPKLRLVKTDAESASEDGLDDAADDDGDDDDAELTAEDMALYEHMTDIDPAHLGRRGAHDTQSKGDGDGDESHDDGGEDTPRGPSRSDEALAPGPRVAPALKRRGARNSRVTAAAKTPERAGEGNSAAQKPQTVSQPTQVNLSTSTSQDPEAPDDGHTSDDAGPTNPESPPTGGRARKGGHLRVVK